MERRCLSEENGFCGKDLRSGAVPTETDGSRAEMRCLRRTERDQREDQVRLSRPQMPAQEEDRRQMRLGKRRQMSRVPQMRIHALRPR